MASSTLADFSHSMAATVDANSRQPNCALLIIRIFFHGTLLVLFPMLSVYAISFPNIFSLVGVAVFLIICLLVIRCGSLLCI